MSRYFRMMVRAACLGLMVLGPVTTAAAQDVGQELQVAGRALGFLESAPSGGVALAVVFDPSIPESVAGKDAAMAALGGGLALGSLTLNPVEVPIGSLAGTSAGALYVTPGMAAHFDAVASRAAAEGIVSIGAELACVEAGACVMGVETQPKVRVVVSQAAASASGIAFKSAFRMMIREI